MSDDVKPGDRVRLIGLPDWLLHDLPESEQAELRQFVGRSAVVSEIDKYGYFWLGFGETVQQDDFAQYSGHSFGVPRDFIERLPPA